MKVKDREKVWQKIIFHILCCFLPCFMILIFGPAEIFFANVTEFAFVYGDFAWHLAAVSVLLTAILVAVGLLLPKFIDKMYVSLILGIAVDGYIQIMFLNGNLDLLGRNSEGYNAGALNVSVNLVIWISIIVLIYVLALRNENLWKKILIILSLFLLAVQIVAYVSLLITANDDAYKRVEKGYHLSGANQFTVSANENVIVFVLDMFSNSYINELENAYPGAIDFLHDFTYYSNADCTYFGTFPSLAHMLSGCEVNMQQSVNDWCRDIWSSDSYSTFSDMLASKNYISNLYTSSLHVLIGNNDASILNGKFENISNQKEDVEISFDLLYKTIYKMSAYRMAPEVLKNCFYTQYREYVNIVSNAENKVYYENYEFYRQLCYMGLDVDNKHNYYNFYHLEGAHEAITDEFCHYKIGATMDETLKGCMVLINEYLNQLKRLGVYDKSSIIITADHGTMSSPQVLFFMKEKGEHHDELKVDNTPISHKEFLSTIACTIDKNGGGIQNLKPDMMRERDYFWCVEDSEYPKVPYYTHDRNARANVYYRYAYVGDGNELSRILHDENPDEIIPIVDSVY